MTWTSADNAELDVMVDELARTYSEHRERCEACRPEPCPILAAYRDHRDGCWKCQNGVKVATEAYGEPCWIYLHFIAHGDNCKRCNPCPVLKSAIGIVLDWRQHRELRSRAEELRIERTLLEAAS